MCSFYSTVLSFPLVTQCWDSKEGWKGEEGWMGRRDKVRVQNESESRSVMSNSLWPHGLYSPWNSLGQNTGVGSLSLLQGIFSLMEFQPRNRTGISCIAGGFFTNWAIREGRVQKLILTWREHDLISEWRGKILVWPCPAFFLLSQWLQWLQAFTLFFSIFL